MTVADKMSIQVIRSPTLCNVISGADLNCIWREIPYKLYVYYVQQVQQEPLQTVSLFVVKKQRKKQLHTQKNAV